MDSNRREALFPSGHFGPRPRYALLPLAGVAAVCGTLLSRSPAPAVAGPTSVTAFKPAADGTVSGGDLGDGMPIEVVYGVPTARWLHLWVDADRAAAATADAG